MAPAAPAIPQVGFTCREDIQIGMHVRVLDGENIPANPNPAFNRAMRSSIGKLFTVSEARGNFVSLEGSDYSWAWEWLAPVGPLPSKNAAKGKKKAKPLTVEVGKWYAVNSGGFFHCTGVHEACGRTHNGQSGFYGTHFESVNGPEKSNDQSGSSRLWFFASGAPRTQDGDDSRPRTPTQWKLTTEVRSDGKPVDYVPTTADTTTALVDLIGAMNRKATEEVTREVLAEEMEAARADISASLSADLLAKLAPTIDELVAQRAAAVSSVKELIVTQGEAIRTVSSPHPKLEEAVQMSQAINNLWFCGPAGSGKTTLAHQLAQALGRDFAFISCTAGMSESKLLGRMNVHGTYLPSEFVRIYEEGGVFLWDEFDAADPNVVLCANAAMANGHLAVPDRVEKPIATRHKDTLLVAATNTWGRGSTSEYSARESMDAATRDRFVLSKIEVTYAPAIEFQFLGVYTTTTPTAWTAPKLSMNLQTALVTIRANIEKHHLRRILSTRVFAQAAALRAVGWSDSAILTRYFIDWSEAERVKGLEGVC